MKKDATFQQDGKATLFRPSPHVLIVTGTKPYLDAVAREAAEYWVNVFSPIKKGKR